MRHVFTLASLLLLPACATIVKGSSQDIAVNSSPGAASCQIAKGTAQIATIPVTPGTARVSRSSEPVTVTCMKQGYETTAFVAPSSVNGWIFGNLLFGGLVGIIVDASTGAGSSYPDSVLVTLPPSRQVAPAQPGPYVPGEGIRLSPQQPGV